MPADPSCVSGQPRIKLTSLDVFLFILTALLGAILSGDAWDDPTVISVYIHISYTISILDLQLQFVNVFKIVRCSIS